MKTLSVKQPWAQLICEGIKDIENRTWSTKYRGRVLIHASAIYDYDSERLIRDEHLKLMQDRRFEFESIKKGVIIGSVEIVDCVINHESVWAEKTEIIPVSGKYYTTPKGKKPIYNFVLANPILFPKPIPAKGKLGFWEFKHIDSFEINGRLICDCNHSIIRQPDETALIRIKGKTHCRFCGGIY